MPAAKSIRVTHAAALALLLLAAGCSPPDEAERAESPRDPIAALEPAPRDAASWSAALDFARRHDQIPRLASAAQRIAVRHPRRWEPPWIEGECVLWRGGSYPAPDLAAESRPLLERAVRLAREGGDPAGVVRAARRLAFAFKLEGDTDAAMRHLRDAEKTARATGLEPLLEPIGRDLSALETQRGLRDEPAVDATWDAAINHCKREGTLDQLGRLAEEIAAEHPTLWHPVYAQAERTLWLEGPGPGPDRIENARQFHLRALELARAAGDPVGVARTSNRLAFGHKALKDSAEAERLYRRGLAAAEAAGRRDLQAYLGNNLAGLLMTTGQYAQAVDIMQGASEALLDLGLPDRARKLSYNRGVLLKQIGNYGESREILEALYAEASAEGLNDLADMICVAMGNLQGDLRDARAAREWYGRVSAEDVKQTVRARFGLGRVALEAGDLDEAAHIFEQVSDQQEDLRLALISRVFRAEVDLRRGLPDQARERVAPVIDEADRDNLVWQAWKARTTYGKALSGRPDARQEALRHLREAVEIVDDRSTGLDPEAVGYLRGRAEPFVELAAELALEAAPDRAAEVLQVVERAHARSLRRMMGNDDPITGGTIDVAGLQRALDDGSVMLDYLIGDSRGVVVALSREALHVALLPGWSDLRPDVERYTTALRRPLLSAEAREDPGADLARDLDLGLRLYRTLVGPVEEFVAGAKRIYVVPDQDLALLPFGALPVSIRNGRPHFLAERVETAVLPLAGRPPRWDGTRHPLLLAGDPVADPDGGFAPLPHASDELRGIEAVWDGMETTDLLGDELSLARLEALPLPSYRTLHFATHAVASSTDPRRCAVILSSGDRLAMRRIAELSLGPSLIVLSACSTGEGEVVPGEGVVGLSWAFLRAGARGIAASLWSVDDRSTSELMVDFHRGLREGHDPVRALVRAQRAMAGSREHPAYWAPFVIILRPTLGDDAPS
ncbi:MAG: CHAT domain-containing protein [bacterium]|nr:CHAT domain-containing protein [bacterium]